MRQIDFQTKMHALELYLQGYSANEVVEKTGISKGAVISIIKDAREGKFPQLEVKERIDELHSLSRRLRKGEIDLAQAKLGFTFFKRLAGMGIEPDLINGWIEFCSQISPSPPERFIPSAMEFFRVEKETGMAYAEIAAKIKELTAERDKVAEEVGDLTAKEKRARELGLEIEANQEKVVALRSELANSEARVNSLNRLLQRKADKLGISIDELEAKLAELLPLEEEIAIRSKEKNNLEGQIEALTERQEKLSSRMEKAAADFEIDLKLIGEMWKELAEITEMIGGYEEQTKNMEWAKSVLPFLSDPDNVSDDDSSLISIVVNCVDKWVQVQPELQPHQYSLTWEGIRKHVRSKRVELRQTSQ